MYRKFTTICTQGQYLPAGSISLSDCTHPRDGYYAVNDAEIICPEGTYSSGSSARTECTVHECTTAGQFLPEGSTSPSDCKDASRGHYSDSDSSKGSTEAKCIAGTAESASGARTSCSLCPPDKYQPGIQGKQVVFLVLRVSIHRTTGGIVKIQNPDITLSMALKRPALRVPSVGQTVRFSTQILVLQSELISVL